MNSVPIHHCTSCGATWACESRVRPCGLPEEIPLCQACMRVRARMVDGATLRLSGAGLLFIAIMMAVADSIGVPYTQPAALALLLVGATPVAAGLTRQQGAP